MNGEDVDRRMHWLQLARELGQEDDFRALMDDLRREGAEDVASKIAATCDEFLGQPSGPIAADIARRLGRGERL